MTHTNVGKVILNLGALTITEVTTATGKQGYRVQSRERKLLPHEQVPNIINAFVHEARNKGIYKKSKPKDRERHRQIARESYHRRKEETREKRLERNKAWRKAHPEYFREYKKKQRLR